MESHLDQTLYRMSGAHAQQRFDVFPGLYVDQALSVLAKRYTEDLATFKK